MSERYEYGKGAAWDDLLDEARAFEAWYGPQRMGVNAWVGIDTLHGFYGGWSIEGDPLYDEWDESEMTTASGGTPAEVRADLIRIARRYRERTDERNAELRADAEAYRAELGAQDHRHVQRFDGDDPYLVCECGARWDALTGRPLNDAAKAAPTPTGGG